MTTTLNPLNLTLPHPEPSFLLHSNTTRNTTVLTAGSSPHHPHLCTMRGIHLVTFLFPSTRTLFCLPSPRRTLSSLQQDRPLFLSLPSWFAGRNMAAPRFQISHRVLFSLQLSAFIGCKASFFKAHLRPACILSGGRYSESAPAPPDLSRH